MIEPTLQHHQWPGWVAVSATHQGLVRARQEDAYAVLVGTRFASQTVDVMAVFDGLGGEANGREAAQAAQRHLPDVLAAATGPTEVLSLLEPHVDASGGMTTAALVVLSRAAPGRGWALAAGDSSIYRLVRGRPVRVVERDRAGGGITSCLGGGLLTAHASPLQLERDETLLLCTDGVDDVVGVQALARAMQAPALEEGVRRLYGGVETGGAPDNATVIVARRNG